MDVADAGSKPDPKDLEPRPPVEQDLAALCRGLNAEQARYVVVGGFAIIAAGYPRMTEDTDLIVATDPDNEARVYRALAKLPDNAARELQPGELDRYAVIRVADEIIVGLMKSAGGIEYTEAAKDVVVREVEGVPIPFASPRLLWRMKALTHRAKDSPDLIFRRHWFEARGETPPETEQTT
jgi:hypothetical protein